MYEGVANFFLVKWRYNKECFMEDKLFYIMVYLTIMLFDVCVTTDSCVVVFYLSFGVLSLFVKFWAPPKTHELKSCIEDQEKS